MNPVFLSILLKVMEVRKYLLKPCLKPTYIVAVLFFDNGLQFQVSNDIFYEYQIRRCQSYLTK